MRFADRIDAGRKLAAALSRYRGLRPLVLAIPRGGIPVAAEVADALQGELDVLLAHKLGAPSSPEFAIGAVDEAGRTYVSPDAGFAGADDAYIERERASQLESLRQRRARIGVAMDASTLRDRTVIVVDDGLATGATMIAALRCARAGAPAQLVCAVPVASTESLETVRALADDTVCVHATDALGAVGAYYREFPQVGDDEVQRLLAAHRNSPHPRDRSPA